jgi:hypothetical protein
VIKAVSSLVAWCAPVRYQPRIFFGRFDILFALLLGLLAAAISFHGFGHFDPAIYEPQNLNRWFDADQSFILVAITDPVSTGDSSQIARHPLFILLTSPLMRALTTLGVDPLAGVRWIIAGCAFLATAFLFLALRGLGLPLAAAALFMGVFLASATFLHWFSILETYPFSAVSISFMLMILTSAGESRWWAWIIASVATLSVTITNWTLALASVLFRLDIRKAIVLSIAALMIVALLAIAQRLCYPGTAVFFNLGHLKYQVRVILTDARRKETGTRTPGLNVWSAVITSAVAPTPEVRPQYLDRKPLRLIVNNQYSPLSSHTMSGWIAFASWLVLLAGGALGGWANRERRAVFAAVSVFLLGQFALHAVFGEVTFLYSANFFPALVLFTAFSWFSPLRIPAIVAAFAFVVAGGASNYTQFEAATRLANAILVRQL